MIETPPPPQEELAVSLAKLECTVYVRVESFVRTRRRNAKAATVTVRTPTERKGLHHERRSHRAARGGPDTEGLSDIPAEPHRRISALGPQARPRLLAAGLRPPRSPEGLRQGRVARPAQHPRHEADHRHLPPQDCRGRHRPRVALPLLQRDAGALLSIVSHSGQARCSRRRRRQPDHNPRRRGQDARGANRQNLDTLPQAAPADNHPAEVPDRRGGRSRNRQTPRPSRPPRQRDRQDPNRPRRRETTRRNEPNAPSHRPACAPRSPQADDTARRSPHHPPGSGQFALLCSTTPRHGYPAYRNGPYRASAGIGVLFRSSPCCTRHCRTFSRSFASASA